jgi:hypothetical protein
VGALDLVTPPARLSALPLRLPVAEVVGRSQQSQPSRTLGNVAVGGKLEGGVVYPGMKVLLMPANVLATVKVRVPLPPPTTRAAEGLLRSLHGGTLAHAGRWGVRSERGAECRRLRAAPAHTRRRLACESRCHTANAKAANRNSRVWHGATEWPLNDGQIPNPDAVRVSSGTGYHRVEGNRR